jgi:3-methyladenine DNA glycosylase AlkC
MMHTSESLHIYLPMEYSESVQILMKAALKFSGFQYMFFPGFIELYGLDEYEQSIKALEIFTQHSSSEFAVRPFIKIYSHKMMEQMELWAESENHHVRRLSSEGCRPRLPWAIALPEFKKDPSPVIPILEKLKNDESEYVRRSVANNLNDISKDNSYVEISAANN